MYRKRRRLMLRMGLRLSLLLVQVDPGHCCVAHAKWTDQVFVVGEFAGLHRWEHGDQRGNGLAIFGLIGDFTIVARCGMVDGGLGVGRLPVGVI